MTLPSLDEVLGQERAVSLLRHQLERERVSHAFVFHGPEGVGKKTAARALGARLLCKQPEPIRACGTCPSCRKLEAGFPPDLFVLEPNAKGNILIEPIRELEHDLSLRPMEGGARFAIIAGTDGMRTEAQNALLKTLEEPPANSHLVLVGTRPQSLLPTIRSRCTDVRFGLLPEDAAREVLARIRPDETSESLERLAAHANGAPGQVVSLDLEALSEQLEQLRALDTALVPGRPEAAREAVDRATELAKDRVALGLLVDAWTAWTRDQMVLAADASATRLAHPTDAETLGALARQRGLAEIL